MPRHRRSRNHGKPQKPTQTTQVLKGAALTAHATPLAPPTIVLDVRRPDIPAKLQKQTLKPEATKAKTAAAKPAAAKTPVKKTRTATTAESPAGEKAIKTGPSTPPARLALAPRGEGHNDAFIDGSNLILAIRYLGWQLDYTRFRTYLREKFEVGRAYYFLGFIEEHQDIYDALQGAGFELIFKPTLVTKDGTIKGNIDADLVLHAMVELPHYNQAVLVTGDGDFASLAVHLASINKLRAIVVPNSHRYSGFLDVVGDEKLAYLDREQKALALPRRRTAKKAA